MPAPIAAIEVGTHRVRVLVGEPHEDGGIVVLGSAEQPSQGLRKSCVLELEPAVAACRAALEAAEHDSQVDIHQVHLVLSPPGVECVSSKGTVHITHRDREVQPEDVERVREVARAANLPPDREVIHSIHQCYVLDRRAEVVNPTGMQASQLDQHMLLIHGDRTLIENLVNAVSNVPVDVADCAFGGLCAAMAVLTAEQKRGGVLVLDLGAGGTRYVLYAHQKLLLAGSIGIGGDHVTNDLSVGLRIPSAAAEILKVRCGCARPDGRDQVVSVPTQSPLGERTVNLRDAHVIIHARLEELLQLIRNKLDELNVHHVLGSGVVLTGGSAQMKGIQELVENVLDLPCSIGSIVGLAGLPDRFASTSYATVAGMLKYVAMADPGLSHAASRGGFRWPWRLRRKVRS